MTKKKTSTMRERAKQASSSKTRAKSAGAASKKNPSSSEMRAGDTITDTNAAARKSAGASISGIAPVREFVVTRTEVSAKVAAAELALAIDRAAANLVAEAREQAYRKALAQDDPVEDVGVKTTHKTVDRKSSTSPGASADLSAETHSEAKAAVSAPVSDQAPASPDKPEKKPRKKTRTSARAAEPAAPATSGGEAAAPVERASTGSTGSVAAADKPSAPRTVLRRRKSNTVLERYAGPVQSLVERGREVLGIENLRAGQEPALRHILDKRDVLAVMPTGSGKSLLYQLPSLILPGLTVVVSPLIALIKDQIDKMVERGVPVCRFDSTLTVRQERATTELLLAPGGKLVLTTPERMATPEFRELIVKGAGGVGVSLFVVDEAHCVSQWGHDFRPAYLTLRRALEEVGRPPVLATTATAPPHVREDILHQLGMEDAAVVTTTFDRPNLYFEVIALPGDDEKFKTLLTLLRVLPRPGVVYCATVKKVEELYEKLARYDVPVARYHGRMTKKERDTEQERFMEGKELIMIATNAFGLGVDKANIRYVLHYHVPGSLEAYAQEAGRGGRDKKPARCVLLFSPDDVAIQEYFLKGTYPSKRQVRAVYKSLQLWAEHQDSLPTVANLAVGSHVGAQRTRTVLSLLKDEGFVVEHEDHTWWLADPSPDENLLNEKARQYEARRIADRQRLHALLDYVRAPGCRNQVILGYLGEDGTPECGRCDNCLRSREEAQRVAAEASALERSVTDVIDSEDQGEAIPKPKRIIRHRVIRIDEPQADKTDAAAPGAEPSAEQADSAEPVPRPGDVSEARKSEAAVPPGLEPDSKPDGKPNIERARVSEAKAGKRPESKGGPERPREAETVEPEPITQPARPMAARNRTPEAEAPALKAGQMSLPLVAKDTDVGVIGAETRHAAIDDTLAARDEYDDEFEDYEDDEYDDGIRDEYDEYEDYEDGDEDEEYEDGDEEYDDEDEDYEDGDEEYDDDEDYEDGDEDYDDDEEYDDDDEAYEIAKTAAELAEEGYEPSETEITILARKRVPKVRRSKKQLEESTEDTDTGKRRRRRRRRKKRTALPPKSAFTSPVLSQPSSAAESTSYRSRRSHRSGPVIEYVRGPMRINMTPVASATPNDVAPSRQKKRRRRRVGEDFVPGSAEAMDALVADDRGGRRKRRRRRRRAPGRLAGMAEGPVTVFALPGGVRPPPLLPLAPASRPPQDPSAPAATAGDPFEAGQSADGNKRRRRRRRRGRGGRGNKNRLPGSEGNTGESSNSDSE